MFKKNNIMKKLLLLSLFLSLLSCSSNKVLYYQGSNYVETLTLEFNLKTKKYIYRSEGYKTAHSDKYGYGTIINEIPSYFIYFEGDFMISKGLFRNKYLLNEPKEYYYYPQQSYFVSVHSIDDVQYCVNFKFSNNRMEFKKRKKEYSLIVDLDLEDKNDCIEKLDINSFGGLKPLKKIDFKGMEFLDSINFKLLPNPNFINKNQ
jgi:hypothetical protein